MTGLYAVGGADESPTAEVLSIGVGETSWRVDAPAPGPVMQASGCVLHGKIYIAAGPSSQCPGLFVYDPEQDSWSEVEHPSRPSQRSSVHGFQRQRLGHGRTGGPLAARRRASPMRRILASGVAVPTCPRRLAGLRLLLSTAACWSPVGAYRDERVGDFFNSDRVFLLRDAK